LSAFDQSGFSVRFEWGEHGLRALAATTDVLVIVDVLSFSTATDVAVSRGAVVLPFASRDPAAATAYAEHENAILAVQRQRAPSTSDINAYSLSPVSVQHIPPNTRLVLPSPNGSTLSRIAAEHGRTLFAGCLRNASAVAAFARQAGSTVGVIAAGERWPDGSLRPAIEDLVGGGAILTALNAGARSPEAELAAAAFQHARGNLWGCLEACASGRELIESGFEGDVRLAAELDVSTTAPVFSAGAFRAYELTA
jgi:2-phosphosulfolactate phosphatase